MSTQSVQLDVSADSFNAGSEHPWWNESAWFGFAVPERNINGFFYYWHRPNMGLTAGGVAIWDDVGAHRDDCLYYHWFPFNPLPDDADMFAFSLENGMQVTTNEPLQSYRLGFEAPSCSIDLLWEGVTPAHDVTFGAHAKSSGTGDFGDFHYEQFGHVTGTLVIDGETIPVDCHHIRDRSWGVRRPFLPNMRGGLEMAWISDRTAFCATMITPEAPGLDGGVDRLAYGMMLKDGVLSSPASGQRRVIRRGPDGRPLEIEVELEDAEGRTLRATGRTRNCLKYDDLWFVYWSLVEWEVDGERGWGESQDMGSPDMIRRHQRRALRGEA